MKTTHAELSSSVGWMETAALGVLKGSQYYIEETIEVRIQGALRPLFSSEVQRVLCIILYG